MLNAEIDDLRQDSRRNNLRVFGIEQNGDTDNALIKFFGKKKIGVDIKQTYI